MDLLHVGLTCSSEEKADRFYEGLLGFKKLDPEFIPKEMSAAIFGLDAKVKKIYYAGESFRFEIFVYCNGNDHSRLFDHVCFEVKNLEEFLGKCRRSDIDIIRVPKGDYLVTFIKDFDGNLFEIKGK